MSSATVTRPRRPEAPAAAGCAERLAAWGESRRLAEFRAGRLSRSELFVWAARYPDEVPMVNGELPWIACRLADFD